MNSRLVTAGLIAPLVGIAALSLAIAVTFRRPAETWVSTVETAGTFWLYSSIVGGLGAYVIEALGAVALYPWLKRTSRLRMMWVVGLAGPLGVIAFVPWALWMDAYPSAAHVLASTAYGAGAGIISGGMFWFVGFSRFTR
jgi:hypothetical protein